MSLLAILSIIGVIVFSLVVWCCLSVSAAWAQWEEQEEQDWQMGEDK